MRAWPVVLLILAGCSAPPPGADPSAEPEPIVELPTLVHRNGIPAQASFTLPLGISQATGFASFEPTLGVTSDGALFMSNSDGAVVTGHSSIVRSTDQGRTWQDITPKIGPASTPPTSFDPYVHVDAATDRIYNLDMEGLNCNFIQWSDDGGESFIGHPLGCGAPPVLDHPSLFTGPPRVGTTVGYDNVVYLCVNRVADAACATSYDGGIAFTPFRTVFGPGAGESPGATCGGLSGHGITDPDGRAYLGRIHCGVPMVAVSDDDGLTWRQSMVSDSHRSTRHDVELASDAAGNIYAVFVDAGFDLWFAVSRDHGGTWQDPVRVTPPSIETAVFPAVAAGDDGKIAIVYYGTEQDNGTSNIADEVAWTAYIATIPDALAAEPTIATAALHDPADPIAMGPCDDDNRCSGVGDFIDIVIDAEGRPWAALIDTCCQSAVGAIGTLGAGFPLRGEETALPVLSYA